MSLPSLPAPHTKFGGGWNRPSTGTWVRAPQALAPDSKGEHMLRFLYWFIAPFVALGYITLVVLGILGIIALIYAS